jgi:peptide chain release factor 2
LEETTQEKDFWKDNKRAVETSEELAGLKHEVDFWENLDKETKDIEELYELSQEDKNIQKEIEKKLENLEKKFKDAEIKALFSGKYDNRNAIVSIYSGAGGTEAQDWANMLLRMYSRYAENHKLKSRLIDVGYGQEAGIKNATLEIDGQYAYAYLKGENGVHRLVRLSPFNADNLRHTSFALVEVLPEISEDIGKEVEIKSEDLKIDTFRSSGPGGQNVNMRSTAVRITHLPTNIVVACQSERSQAQNKERAMKLLYTKVYQKKLQEKKKEKSEIRGELPSVEWGSQIRSYVLHPYKMVKDHRTECESSNPEAVLDGKLDEFIESEVRLLKS